MFIVSYFLLFEDFYLFFKSVLFNYNLGVVYDTRVPISWNNFKSQFQKLQKITKVTMGSSSKQVSPMLESLSRRLDEQMMIKKKIGFIKNLLFLLHRYCNLIKYILFYLLILSICAIIILKI